MKNKSSCKTYSKWDIFMEYIYSSTEGMHSIVKNKIANNMLLLLSHNYHVTILKYDFNNNEINTNPGSNQEEFTYLFYQYHS